MAYTRALLLVNFGLIGRAILVPSTARRTLVFGAVAAGLSALTSQIVSLSQPP
jgi:hypothetical protein